MKNNLGMGVMIRMLSGNSETVKAVTASLNKTIASVSLDEINDKLRFTFEDGSKLSLWDDGQSCCETRYMRTDDDLREFAGAVLLGFEIKDAPSQSNQDDYGDHDVQFLDVKTDKGVFTMSNHNEHNGYYGGFSIAAELFTPEL